MVVDSIDETLAKVTELGGTVTMPRTPIDDSSAFAAFDDVDGNHIGLYESTSEQGRDRE